MCEDSNKGCGSKLTNTEGNNNNNDDKNNENSSGLSQSLARKDAISWDEYFMGLAFLSAMRSKDPNTQVGACIVDKDNIILGIGYNGFPRGCSDASFPWSRKGDYLDTKYPYVVHAELNAILNSRGSLKDARIYVALFPCNECAKAIIQSGIKEVVYLSDKYSEVDSFKASRKMFEAAGVRLRKLDLHDKKLLIDFSVIDKK